jgi:hypothetical protein
VIPPRCTTGNELVRAVLSHRTARDMPQLIVMPLPLLYSVEHVGNILAKEMKRNPGPVCSHRCGIA